MFIEDKKSNQRSHHNFQRGKNTRCRRFHILRGFDTGDIGDHRTQDSDPEQIPDQCSDRRTAHMTCNGRKIDSEHQHNSRAQKSVDKKRISLIILGKIFREQDLQRNTDPVDDTCENTDPIQLYISAADQIGDKNRSDQTNENRDHLVFFPVFLQT